MVPIQVAIGGTQGVMPLVGYSYTSKNTDRFEKAIRLVVKIMLPCMILTTILFWLFASQMVGLFIKNSEVIAYGKLFLRGFSLSMPFMLIDFLAVSVFQSIGMGKKSLLFAILRKVVFEIPAIILLNALFHEAGITYAGFVSECILAVYGVILLIRITNEFKKTAKAQSCDADQI